MICICMNTQLPLSEYQQFSVFYPFPESKYNKASVRWQLQNETFN